MSTPLPFPAVGRLPAPGDNVAIAIRRLEAGTVVLLDSGARTLAHTVLEGHRFTVRPVAAGEALLSWGLPFGHALTAIPAGTYVCNQSILDWLVLRRVELTIPTQPNFADHLVPFVLDEAALRPAPPVELVPQPRNFAGYRRPGQRGVGTRNTIVILGTTSRTASFARQLAARLQALARVHPSLDGIVAVAHTEGGGPGEPNNSAEILRALAGFMVHPNVGAVLAVDYGVEPVNNARLQAFMRERGYPLADVPHAFLSITRGLSAALAEGEALVRGWLPAVAAQRRTAEPLAHLRVALQCGGSDAFSGVSGNPLAGAMVHELVRHGGIGVLCETDELAGAESYLMKNVRDAATARALLDRIARFKERLAWHGVTPESNPSAGNKLRGLYNITLKSLGAVHKKDPRSRIDHVIDYADPLGAPGFYFMDSPGNDLEGIAGQVGAGCNLFLFVTGNGSITNFPFVPTLKLTTTTRRHELLVHEMDINAGRYLDGESFASLAAESFELLIASASGQKTKGELAGHSQASLWRNWRQTDTSRLAEIRARPAPDGKPLVARLDPKARGDGRSGEKRAEVSTLHLYPNGPRFGAERVGLVMPTSMCSAQIARLAADRMNATGLAGRLGLDRFVALAHSEGCGFGGETMYHLLHRTYRGYATHPNVAAALLLEHGCEKVPNDVMKRQFESANLPLDRFGWASVQLDGGIDKALGRVGAWFESALASRPATTRVPAGLGALTVGVLSAGPLGPAGTAALAGALEEILAAGGSVLIPEGDRLLADERFRGALLGRTAPHATLAYGQPLTDAGLHVVQTDTDHWTENLAGLGACGVQVFLGIVGDTPQQGHPLLPLWQLAEAGTLSPGAAEDVDLMLAGEAADAGTILGLVAAAVSGERSPKANAGGFVDFQLSRGLLGVTT
ncbi:altronate hydrolase [Oleiharenicola lentus]|uniref:Altronate hydrolase n=1 Tax=Oleiharenicola lentus TaxID=2508720 RepID=A0A4Q1C6T5_9BACT|nr:UxaA family hydrolase [Oleiharenicola lentus]RXK54506.1 altronate hydrolase [Oleiharenicola lentus]